MPINPKQWYIYSKSKKLGTLVVLGIFREHEISSSCSARRWASDDVLLTSFLSSRHVSDEAVSSMKNKVNIAAMTDTIAHNIMTWALPSHEANGRKIDEPSNAPHFPLAAHTPLRVDRHGREKVMLGSIKVCSFWKANEAQIMIVFGETNVPCTYRWVGPVVGEEEG